MGIANLSKLPFRQPVSQPQPQIDVQPKLTVAEAEAALLADAQLLSEMEKERNEISRELESAWDVVKLSPGDYFKNIPVGDLRTSLTAKDLTKTKIPSLQNALAEAERRVKVQGNLISSHRATLNQRIREARIPEIWERADALFPQWIALEQEVRELTTLWPTDVSTTNMPECMRAIGTMRFHMARLTPSLEAALKSRGKR